MNRKQQTCKIAHRVSMLVLGLLVLSLLPLLSACSDGGTASGGYTVSYGGVTLQPDIDMATVLSTVKESYVYSESPSCAFEGMDKAYTYGGHIRIETYPKDGKDYISGIYLKDDSVNVSGLKIGMTVSEMEEKLGKDYTTSGGTFYTYSSGSGSELKVIVKDGMVVDIRLLSAYATD